MSEINLTEDELNAQHKKERKELQAQIQTLKKSICKGDKKKKREITEEIARLEINLDAKHEQELANLTSAPEEEIVERADAEIAEDLKSEEIPQRVTKAQKRRDKRSNAERERNQRILEQEAENVFGKRNVETQAIKKILSERDLKLHEISSDGHCLYNAISHQLKEIGEVPLGYKALREQTSDHLRAHMNDFVPYITNSESDNMLTVEQYEKYCENVADSNAWGGAVELQVLSRVLKCPIEVIQATGTPYIIGEEYTGKKTVTVTYHRHMYELGAHYNSVTKSGKKEES